ncbi:ABC transporter substrate-binding protein [Cellulosimicrobium cellulans]|uniref:ABC transporter substrate-binding protein n=1 Tax=Cellulosimicrobium cellulans TaxID=1710 RepID=UPI00084967CC|nr:ABC transporter substrate-binding protein [Cellulosimicrobium cellulans]
MTTNRTLATGATLALVAATALTACSDATASGGDHPEPVASIDVGVAPDFFYTHLYLAVEQGFFAEQGIDATLTEYPSGAEATEAITAGQNDLTSSTATTLASLAGSGSPARSIGGNLVGNGWFAVVGNESLGDVSSVEDLEGASVAAQHTTVLDMHVRTFLDSHGESVDLIDYQDVKMAQLITGLTRGDYQAASMWEPNVTKALESVPGASVVLDSDEALDVAGYLVASADVYEDQDVADRVLTAIAETIEWMDAHPEEVLATAMENSGLDDEELAQTVQDKITYEMSGFTPERVAEIEAAAAFFTEQGVIDATAEETTETYLPEVYDAWASSSAVAGTGDDETEE